MKKKAIDDELSIPLSNTARKFGYIMWRKRHDQAMQSLIGERQSINLQIGSEIQKEKNIDWKRRRIGITYSLTRKLPLSVNAIRLKRIGKNNLCVSFE